MDQPPNSFNLSLLEGWAMADAPPAGSRRVTLQRIDEGGPPPALAGLRVPLDELPDRPDQPGMQVRFSLHQGGTGSGTAAAELGVGFFAFGGDSRPEALMPVLAAGAREDTFDIVRLQAGPALRREGSEGRGWVLRFYVPIPATSGEIALLVFRGPEPKLPADVADRCDAMAGAFNFRFGDEPAPTPAELADPIRARIEEQAMETGGLVSADLGDGSLVSASGPAVLRRRSGAAPSPFIEDRYGFRRVGWSGRPWQAPELAAEAAAKSTGKENALAGRAALLVWVAYSVAALALAPGVTKAPVVLLGVGITIAVLRRTGDASWKGVIILAAVLAVTLFLVLAAGG
jgi:hypothetical protein